MTRYGYLRISTDMQGFESQKHLIGGRHNIDAWIEDTGSGRITQPNLQALINDLKPGDELVVAAFDRLGRNMSQMIDMVELLKAKKVSIISIREGVDLSTPAGTMAFHMLSSIAQFEVSIISDRVKRGLEAAKARGTRLGKPPHSDNPEKRQALLEGCRLKLQGHSYYDILRILEERQGHRFAYNTLRKFVRENISREFVLH